MEGLIDSVRSYPCLWRVHLKEYKDLRVKENAWKKVAEETGLLIFSSSTPTATNEK